MKVSELITKLQKLDQDKMIVISGYESGCDFPNTLKKVHIILDQHNEWYYGKHSCTYFPPEDGEWNAYILENTND